MISTINIGPEAYRAQGPIVFRWCMHRNLLDDVVKLWSPYSRFQTGLITPAVMPATAFVNNEDALKAMAEMSQHYDIPLQV